LSRNVTQLSSFSVGGSLMAARRPAQRRPRTSTSLLGGTRTGPRSTERGPAATRRSCSRHRPKARQRPREDQHADLVGFGGPGWSRHLMETSPSRKRVASAPGHLQSPVAFRHCLDHPLSLVRPDCHTPHRIRKRIPI